MADSSVHTLHASILELSEREQAVLSQVLARQRISRDISLEHEEHLPCGLAGPGDPDEPESTGRS